jgi:hypothetical protein
MVKEIGRLDMNVAELTALLDRLRAEPRESEWMEFKANRYEPQLVGEYPETPTGYTGGHRRDVAGQTAGSPGPGTETEEDPQPPVRIESSAKADSKRWQPGISQVGFA